MFDMFDDFDDFMEKTAEFFCYHRGWGAFALFSCAPWIIGNFIGVLLLIFCIPICCVFPSLDITNLDLERGCSVIPDDGSYILHYFIFYVVAAFLFVAAIVLLVTVLLNVWKHPLDCLGLVFFVVGFIFADALVFLLADLLLAGICWIFRVPFEYYFQSIGILFRDLFYLTSPFVFFGAYANAVERSKLFENLISRRSN